MVEWKDGGGKPLAKAETCAVCGEQIMAQSRDYYYGRDGDAWVRAHRACVDRLRVDEEEARDRLMIDIRDALNSIAKSLERMKERGDAP